MPGNLCKSSHFIFTSTLRRRYCHPHLVDEKAQVLYNVQATQLGEEFMHWKISLQSPFVFFSPIRIMAQFTKTQPGTLCFYPLFLFIVNKTPKVMTADRSMISKKCDALILRKVSVLSISSKCLRQSCEMSKKQVRIVC